MTELVWAPLVCLDVVFALICAGVFPQSLLKNLHGRLASVNFFGLLKVAETNVDLQKSHMAPKKVRLQFGRRMRLRPIGRIKRNMKATWDVYTEYNGDVGKRRLNIKRNRLQMILVTGSTGKGTYISKKRINSKI